MDKQSEEVRNILKICCEDYMMKDDGTIDFALDAIKKVVEKEIEKLNEEWNSFDDWVITYEKFITRGIAKLFEVK